MLTCLNRDFLRGVKTKAERYTIYADLCTLSPAELEQYHITFKKIPRTVVRGILSYLKYFAPERNSPMSKRPGTFL